MQIYSTKQFNLQGMKILYVNHTHIVYNSFICFYVLTVLYFTVMVFIRNEFLPLGQSASALQKYVTNYDELWLLYKLTCAK